MTAAEQLAAILRQQPEPITPVAPNAPRGLLDVARDWVERRGQGLLEWGQQWPHGEGLLGKPMVGQMMDNAQQTRGMGIDEWFAQPSTKHIAENMAMALQTNTPGRLPMDVASRMGRAKDMGFHERPFYHATDRDFSAFDLKRAGSNTTIGSGERAVFLTDSPKAAETFLPSRYVAPPNAKPFDFGVKEFGEGAQMMPLRVRGLENFDVWEMSGGAYRPAFVKEAIKEARKSGAPGVVFMNMADAGHGHAGKWPVSNVVAVLKPQNIRSRFAAFDPAKANSPDLMAAALPFGLLGAGSVGGGLLNNNYNPEPF